jgi:aryl-phospho-beta-D-glucosidase BglC (GH1 family)
MKASRTSGWEKLICARDGLRLAFRNMNLKTQLPGAIGLALLCLQSVALAQNTNPPAQLAPTNVSTRLHTWWRDPAPGQRPHTVNNKQMPLISVKGNKFTDTNGNTVLFRGLDISDPDKLEMQGHWNRDHFAKIKEMGAKLVRIPVHPVAWRERTPAEYLKLLDQAVDWCTELDMYIIIDWHTIGNLETEVFQNPMYDTTKVETYNFWRTMARHFAGHNTVAFFELFNEPATIGDRMGPVSWSDWKRTVEEEITLIRANDPQVIPLVAGFDWAYDLTPVCQQAASTVGTEMGGGLRFRRRQIPGYRHRVRRLCQAGNHEPAARR